MVTALATTIATTIEALAPLAEIEKLEGTDDFASAIQVLSLLQEEMSLEFSDELALAALEDLEPPTS